MLPKSEGSKGIHKRSHNDGNDGRSRNTIPLSGIQVKGIVQKKKAQNMGSV